MRIYIAGPYTARTEQERVANVMAAIDAAIHVFRRGHSPYVPHLTHYVDARAQQLKDPLTWEDYMVWDLAWLDTCDAILYLGSSKGADIELCRARAAGKKTFLSVESIPLVSRSSIEASANQ